MQAFEKLLRILKELCALKFQGRVTVSFEQGIPRSLREEKTIKIEND